MVEAFEARREPKRFGPLGWRELLEPRLRRLVAEFVGIPPAWLRADVAFGDDLAMSRADVTELVVAAEGSMGVTLSEEDVDGVQTFGDLADRVVHAQMVGSPSSPPRVFVRATLVPPRRDRRPVLLRSTWLSPYAVETLVADARRAGPGARLDVAVPASAPLVEVEHVARCFASLADFGVEVRVQHTQVTAGRAVA